MAGYHSLTHCAGRGILPRLKAHFLAFGKG
jgi:hypothetical protein